MLIVDKQMNDTVQLCIPFQSCHCSPLFAHLIRREQSDGREGGGLLTSQGTGVLFALIAIIEVPLDFTDVCKKLGGRREGEEAWAS